jgi:hypothetical protein
VLAGLFDPLFDPTLLAEPASAGGRVFHVIFDAAGLTVGGFVETVGPSCLVRDSDLQGLDHDSEIVLQGVTYVVTGKEPDGSGMTTLQLRKA